MGYEPPLVYQLQTHQPDIVVSKAIDNVQSGLNKSETTDRKRKNDYEDIYLATAAMLLSAALAVSAKAQNQVPFKGSFQGQEIDIPQRGPPPTTLSANGNATGIGTLVGRLSFTYQLTVTLATATATGSGRLVAANGDRIYTTIVGLTMNVIGAIIPCQRPPKNPAGRARGS